MSEPSASTPSVKSQRRKTPSYKARQNEELQAYLKSLQLDDDSCDEVYAESASSLSLSEEETSSESQDEAEDILEDDDDKIIEKQTTPKFLLPNKISNKTLTENTIRKTKKSKQSYAIKTDEYFYHHSIKKSQTSGHTLDKLKTSRLSQGELRKFLSNLSVKSHNDQISEIYAQNKSYFNKWICLLQEGFNILLYGLGSKRGVLHDFHKEYLSNLPAIIVNGFFPSLTIKEIIDSIMIEILELDVVPANIFEALQTITNEFEVYSNLHLYIIVHNIEGEMLRVSLKNQSILASLAAINNIHLIASIDHINAPLIWDQNKLSKFNFTWWDITTFLPYKDETSFETSMMISKTGSLALSSLRNVFLSLTSNSKGIFLIIAKYQLESAGQFYQGMLFKDLYSACREAFLVSSDLTLRAQLTEFVDHKMVKFKRSMDGAEYLRIPIPNNLLQQFLNDQ